MNVIKQTGTANTTYAPGRVIKYLAIHYTAGVSCSAGSASGCASWFANPAAGGSADYICDERDLIQYNPDPYNRYCHAVGSKEKYNTKGGRLWRIATNANCISLEICSGNRTGKITYPNDPNYYFTAAVVAKAIEVTKFLMDLYEIDADHVIRHYDCNAKLCPGIYGWNKDSGSETAWESFHESIGGAPIHWYRIRLAWDKPDTQINAYLDLEAAKKDCDSHPGFSVYDDQGKAIYTSKADLKPPEGDSESVRWITMLAPDAMDVCHKNGLLASVMLAQASLETGWGKTDLAKRNNIFGMKCDLINGTWKEWSTWNGQKYEKYSPEERNGHVEMVKSAFRVYDSYRQCMEDYAAFLLHVRNDKGLKYACIKGWTDPAKVIHRIRIGTGTDAHPEGYATDSGYEVKIMNLIRKYNLTQYDGVSPVPIPTPEPAPQPPQPEPEKNVMFRVQVEADHSAAKADDTMILIKDRTRAIDPKKQGYDCFKEYDGGWWRVFCGSFRDKAKAEERRLEIVDLFKQDRKFQNAFLKEVQV